jgi:hypothetical protein
MTDLLLKSSGPVADQYKLLAGEVVVGHIRLSESAPPTAPWRWTLSHGQHKGRRTPTHGYGTTREEALQAFARSLHQNRAHLEVVHGLDDKREARRAAIAGCRRDRVESSGDSRRA